MDYIGFDDETLMRLMAQANPDALSALYDRYSRLVYGLAWNILGEAGPAEEVTQDTFLSAWRHAASYQAEQGKTSTWLASIARNRAIDYYRQKMSRRENQQVSIDAQPVFNLVDPQNVEKDVDLRGEQRRVRRALSQLPPEQCDALALAYFKGLTQEEIAQVTGQPLGTIKTRIRLGMQKLRQLLSEEPAELKDGKSGYR